MTTITKAQSEALTKFGVKHTGKESIKEANDLLELAIYEFGMKVQRHRTSI